MKELIEGRGLFKGHKFAAVVPSLRAGNYVVRDLTKGPGLDSLEKLKTEGFVHDVGRYSVIVSHFIAFVRCTCRACVSAGTAKSAR